MLCNDNVSIEYSFCVTAESLLFAGLGGNQGTEAQIYDQYGMYFLTLTVMDWVDVSSRRQYHDIVMDSLKFLYSKCFANQRLAPTMT